MKDFINSLGFDKIKVLEEDQATEQAVNHFFIKLASRSLKHLKRYSGKKLLVFIYYSGHGVNVSATQRVTLKDCVYPLELKIRQFKNNHY